MSEHFVIATEILVRVTEKGTIEATVQGTKALTGALKDLDAVSRTTTRGSRSQAYAIRRLALDLRMLSIGLMILKREYGGISPAIDATISGLYKASAVSSVAIGATGMLARTWRLLGLEGKSVGEAVGGFRDALNAGSLSMMGYAGIVIGTVAAMVLLGTAVFEQVSGISRLRAEIRPLKEDLEELKDVMRDLQVAQADLTAEGAKYTYVIAALKREIELTGDPTGELETRLKAAQAAQADLRISSLEVSWALSQERAEFARTEDQIEDYKDQITEAYKAAGQAVGGGPGGAIIIPGGPGGVPQQQLGGEVRRGGIVNVEAGEVIMQREQTLTMMRGAGGPISVSISLAGAQISGIEDLVGTLRRGAAEAGEELKRLELLRYRTRSRY